MQTLINRLGLTQLIFVGKENTIIYNGRKLVKIGRYNFVYSNDFESIVSQNSLWINRFEFWAEKNLVILQRPKTRQNKAV